MTGDQQPADLLNLPFDQYQRYRIVSEILSILNGQGVFPADKPVAILDVGGYPGLLPRFVPINDARTFVLDVVPDTGSAARYNYTYVIGSGMELPFPDGAFSCAVSLDTLEHVPAEARPKLLAEMQRVARDAAIFVGPVHREETALTEELLFDYIQWLLKAKQEQLAEHRGYGLPVLEQVQQQFAAAGWSTLVFPAGNLYNWLFMMVAKHFLISFRDDQASELEQKLDRFYNLTFSEDDRQEPAYRGIMVALKGEHPQALIDISARYPALPAAPGANMERLEIAQLLMRLLDLKVANHEDAALREQLIHRERHASGLEQQVDSLKWELEGSRNHSKNLEAIVQTSRAHAENLQRVIDHPSGGIAALTTALGQLRTEADFLREEHYKHVAMIAALEAEVEQKNQHILYLEQLLQKIEAGAVLKLTRNISRLIK